MIILIQHLFCELVEMSTYLSIYLICKSRTHSTTFFTHQIGFFFSRNRYCDQMRHLSCNANRPIYFTKMIFFFQNIILHNRGKSQKNQVVGIKLGEITTVGLHRTLLGRFVFSYEVVHLSSKAKTNTQYFINRVVHNMRRIVRARKSACQKVW